MNQKALRLVRQDLTPLKAALILLVTLVAYASLLRFQNSDTVDYLVPWTQELRASGFGALGSAFSNYNPPYLYLLFLFSLLPATIPDLDVVKLASIASTILLGAAAYLMLSALLPRVISAFLASTVLLLPTVILNGPLWGQIDSLWAAAALATSACALRGQHGRMFACFGLALSIKLQSIFIAPVLLAIVIARPSLLRFAPFAVMTYLLMLLPAWLANRPLAELLTIYAQQGNYYQSLSKNAPNIWSFLQVVFSYEIGTIIGGLAAFIAGLAIAARAARRVREQLELVRYFLLAALLMPYLLPKMHDRYFFLADVLSVLLWMLVPSRSNATIALFCSAGSLLAYLQFLFGDSVIYMSHLSIFGAVLMSVAVWQAVGEERLSAERHLPSDAPTSKQF